MYYNTNAGQPLKAVSVWLVQKEIEQPSLGRVAVVAFHAQNNRNRFAAYMERKRDLHMYHLLSEEDTPTAFWRTLIDIAGIFIINSSLSVVNNRQIGNRFIEKTVKITDVGAIGQILLDRTQYLVVQSN